jgi:Hemerythrin HHE cation binding domain
MAVAASLSVSEHDHVALAATLEAMNLALESRAPDLGGRAAALREAFLEHFGDEEELLFPALLGLRPALAYDLDHLRASHDALCGLAVRIAELANRAGEPQADIRLREFSARLNRAYREHARTELELLRKVAAELSPAETEVLEVALRP